MPNGFALEREGPVRWLYPSSAGTEVAALRSAQRRTWARISQELGAYVDPELDIRVAVNPDQMQVLAAGLALPDYATGVALPAQGVILLSLTEPESWLRPNMERVLAHELSHVALHRAVQGRPLPRWFSEGVAIHQAGENSLSRIRTLWEATLRGQVLPLRELDRRFPSKHGAVSVAYAQAADLVGHMLDGETGASRFSALLGLVRGGQDFEPAFALAYGMPLSRMEQQWRAELRDRFGRWPSILSGLTLVWGLSALLLIAGYVRVRRRQRQTLKRWAIEEAPLLTGEMPPPPPPTGRSVADEVLDAWGDQQRRDSGVPTVVHEGRSHTLH